jgi:hypothetical protein
MLLDIEKVAQYRGDTSIIIKVQNMNNRINAKISDQNQRKVVGFVCMLG